jgi:hypothetical protein
VKKLALLMCVVIPALAWAGDVIINPAYQRTLSLGTKGLANYSTAYRDGMKFKAVNASGAAVAVKVLFDGSESNVYPTSEDTYTLRRGNVSKVGFRAYTTASPVTVHVLGW